MRTKNTFLITLVVAFLLFIHPQDAICQWVSSSPPGIEENSNTGVWIAVGVIVTGVLVFLIVKNNKKKKESTSYSIDSGSEYISTPSFYGNFKNVAEKSPVEFIVGNNDAYNHSNYGISNRLDNNINGGISVGLRFKF